MKKGNYQLSNYITDIKKIIIAERDEKTITQLISPLAKRLAASNEFQDEKYKVCDEEQGFGVHLLHEEANHELGIFVFSWLPGRGTLPHNHKTWAVIAVIDGEEHEIYWERKDDESQPGYAELKKSREETMTAGDIASCGANDIHSVMNTGQSVSLSLHTYGKHINFTGRSQFDPEKNSENPFMVAVE